MKELPKILVNEEENKKNKTIEFEIKSNLIGGNESSKHITNPDERKIKRVNDLIIEKKELEKAPHPPQLPIPKMPQKAPHPPQLPIPANITVKMRMHLLKEETSKNAELTGKNITKTIKQINYFLIFGIIFLIAGLFLLLFGLYGKISIENKYKKYTSNFSINNMNDLKSFCYDRKYKDCENYVIYINGIENILNKNYDEAKIILNKISDFENSLYYINYIDGINYIESYQLEDSKKMFEKTKDILNSEYYLKYIDYINEINENKDINIGSIYLIEDKINLKYISNYIDGKKLFDEKNYKRVIEILEQSSNVINDAKEILYESKYIYAKNMQYEGYISTAFKLLNEIKNYKDANKILENPIYYVIDNWYYTNDKGFSIVLSFYESSDTCYNEIKNGTIIGLPYNGASIYEYKIKNNIIYFKNNENIYKPIYIIKRFEHDKLTIFIEGQIIELHKNDKLYDMKPVSLK